MKLTGVHLLLTYECNFECDHCFVWSSPRHKGTMSPEQIREILEQSKRLGTVEWIYFEGGEPFLYHAELVEVVQRAHRDGRQELPGHCAGPRGPRRARGPETEPP